MASSTINSIGLIFDLIGALLLFKYGLPSKIHTPPGLLLESDLSDNQIKENKKIECWANTAVTLLVLGFLSQLVSNFL